MIYELQILNIPHDKATHTFREFLLGSLDLKNTLIVHYQQKDNKKVLLLRLKDFNKYEELSNKKLSYEEFEVEFKPYERESIAKVNNMLNERKKLSSEGGLTQAQNEEEMSKVYLNNLPMIAKVEDVTRVMKKFGTVVSVDIVGDKPIGAPSKRKKLKCRFAVVLFSKFEEAVEAFYHDKVQIGKKRLKIKLFAAEKASKFVNRFIGTGEVKEQKVNKFRGKEDQKPKFGNKFNNLSEIHEERKFTPETVGSPAAYNQNEMFECLRRKAQETWKHINRGPERYKRPENQKEEVFSYNKTLELPITEMNHYYRNLRMNKGKKKFMREIDSKFQYISQNSNGWFF